MSKKLLISVIIIAMVLTVLTACAPGEEGGFSIEFVVDGKTVHTVTTSGLEKITLPSNPTKAGYIFKGWYLDQNTWKERFTADSLLNLPLTANIKVYAYFVVATQTPDDPSTPDNPQTPDTYPVSTSLGQYPTDLKADGFSAEFSMMDYLSGSSLNWEKVDTVTSTSTKTVYEDDIRTLQGAWNSSTKTYTGSGEDVVYDAITLFLLASYNESTLPYYQSYLDAGATASIGTALSGGLMVQGTIKVNNEGEYKVYFKEQINASANVQASPALINAFKGIDSLNKAIREGIADNKYYYKKGNSPSYVTDTATGQFPDPPSLDDGYTIANWSSTGNDRVENTFAYSQKDQSQTASWRYNYNANGTKGKKKSWGEMYQQKYIIDLQNDAAVGQWFSDASIETVYVDEDGNETTTVTDKWFLRVSFSANIPELPEDFDTYTPDEQQAYLNNQGFNNIGINTANKNKLVDYTGANPVIYTKLTYVADIWDMGIFRNWRTEEGWFGSLVGLQSNVKPYSPTVYSYTKSEVTEEVIKQEIQDYIVATQPDDWQGNYDYDDVGDNYGDNNDDNNDDNNGDDVVVTPPSLTSMVIDAIFEAIENWVPDDVTNNLSMTADVDVIFSDFVIFHSEEPVDIFLDSSLSVNLNADYRDKNMLNLLVRGDSGVEVLEFTTKGEYGYIDGRYYSEFSEIYAVLDGLSTFLDDNNGYTLNEFKEDLKELIIDMNLTDLLNQIIEITPTATGYEARLILANEGEGKAGIIDTGLLSILNTLITQLTSEDSMLGSLIEFVLPYVLGDEVSNLLEDQSITRDDVNDIVFSVDIDSTTGELTKLSVLITAGENVELMDGSIAVDIYNIVLSAEENTDLTGKDLEASEIPDDPEEATKTEITIGALFDSLDVAWPDGFDSIMSFAGDISIQSDMIIYKDGETIIDLSIPLDLSMSVALNLEEADRESNIIDLMIETGLGTIELFSKGNTIYITDYYDVDDPITYALDLEWFNYSTYLDNLPRIFSNIWDSSISYLYEESFAEVFAWLKNILLEGYGPLINPIVENIIDVETTATDTATTYDIRLVIANEDDTLQGVAGVGIAELLAPILSSLDDEIVEFCNNIITALLGKPLDELTAEAPYTKDDVNEIHFSFDVDNATGAFTGFRITFATGENVDSTSGSFVIAVDNLEFKSTENTALVYKEVPENAIPIGAELEVDLDFGNDDLDMSAVLQLVPSFEDRNMQVVLKSVALDTGNTIYNADDLCVEYALVEGSEDKYAIKVDLTALFKVAFKDELAGGVALADVLAANGIYTTQYYYEINIDEFLTNSMSKYSVRIGMAGTDSHEAYEYLWLHNDVWSMSDDDLAREITRELVKDTELCDKIFRSYGISVQTEYYEQDFYIVIEVINYTTRYTVYPAEYKRTVTFVDDNGDYIARDYVAAGNYYDPSQWGESKEGYFFKGWSLTQNGEVIDGDIFVEDDITLYSVFEDEDGKWLLDVYRYDLSHRMYVKSYTMIADYNTYLEDIVAEDIYGMAFAFWMQEAAGELNKIDDIDENTTAIYPVYKTLNTMDAPITVEGDDSQIIAEMPKRYFGIDGAAFAIDIISTALQAMCNKSLSIGEIVNIMSAIDAFDVDDTTQLADRILYLAVADASTVRNFYYNVNTYVVDATDLQKAVSKLSNTQQSYDKYVVEYDYMSDLINYTVYYRFVAIYGNLTKTEVTENWQYGWTDYNWAAYSAAGDAEDRAEAYKTISASNGIRIDEGTLESSKAAAEEKIMIYINNLLNTDYDTLEDFLFAEGGLKIDFELGRDADSFNVRLNLCRGDAEIVARIDASLRLFDGRLDLTLDEGHTWDTAGMLDFRALDMTLIKDANGDQAIDTTGWTAQDYTDFATQYIIGEDTITFRGQTYDYDADKTTFTTSIANLFAKIDAKMVEQPA